MKVMHIWSCKLSNLSVLPDNFGDDSLLQCQSIELIYDGWGFALGVSLCAIPRSQVSCDGFHINHHRSWPSAYKGGSLTLGPPHEVQSESAKLPTSWNLWPDNCWSLDWPSMHQPHPCVMECLEFPSFKNGLQKSYEIWSFFSLREYAWHKRSWTERILGPEGWLWNYLGETIKPFDCLQVASVIHEWTYDAMCHDLLDMDGNKYIYEVSRPIPAPPMTFNCFIFGLK